jgi:menaquinone-dependent protoporphyrinogen oxidase
VRVLVVYGSARGGTAGLAHMVAEAFVARDILADVGDSADVDEIGDYDAVVLGGALYNGRWHQEASWFVERNLEDLRQRPVWFFSSGPLDESARDGAMAPVDQVQDLARRADIRGHMTFGGVLEKRPSRFLSALLAWGKPGDFRDRDHVDEWVERIVARLGEALPESDEAAVGTAAGTAATDEPAPAKRTRRRLIHARSGEDDLGLDVLAGS